LIVTVRNVTETATLSAAEVAARVERALTASTKALKKKRPLSRSAVEAFQLGALHHTDPQMRRWCLFFLDHYANDTSMAVFAEALHDDVPAVRDLALHSIACEPCKDGELCVADAVPPVVRVLEADPAPSLRIKAIGVLLGLASRDARAGEALKAAARIDPDPLVRECARQAAAGRWVPPKKRYQRHQRRHAAVHH
jgi:HEAT repeat protein